jgi:hypothetical protein
MSDFVGQISGLLILTCAAGVIWLGLMGLVMQRAAERRRRVRAGLPPLPGFHVTAARWIMKQWQGEPKALPFSSEPAPAAQAPASPRGAPTPMPVPDLALLMGDLPEPPAPAPAPDLAAIVPEPVSDEWARAGEAEPPPGPDEDVESPADTFATELAPDSAAAPPPNAFGDPGVDVPGAGEAGDDLASLLHVWRDLSSGTLIMEACGERFESPARIRDAEARRRFAGIVAELVALGGIGPEEPRPARPVPADRSLGAPGGPPPPDSAELLRVWRDLADGTLLVEMKDRRFAALAEMEDEALQRRFVSVVRELDALARSAPEEPRRPAAPPPPRAKEPDPAAPPVSMSPGAMLRGMARAARGQAPEPVEEKPAPTIADQIEELLQARLADLPAYRQRAVHVSPSSQGGVRIEVDGSFYEGVGDVEDAEVRALLADVVREWESRQ